MQGNFKFRKLVYKINGVDASRGSDDSDFILETMKNDWGNFQDQLKSFSADEVDSVKDYFNENVTELDSAGDVLFSDVDEFSDALTSFS